MAEIRDVAQIAQKWSRNASNATPNYEAGVQNPRRSWQASTIASEAAYEQGVTAAIQRKSFGAGVRGVSDAEQKDLAATKGSARYAQGVQVAEGKYAKNFAPYAAIIRSTNLPARGPRGSAQNLQRVSAISNALFQARVARTQGGNR